MNNLYKLSILIISVLLIIFCLYGIPDAFYKTNVEGLTEQLNQLSLRNTAIKASRNTIASNKQNTLENIENVIRNGTRWLDFELKRNKDDDKIYISVDNVTTDIKFVDAIKAVNINKGYAPDTTMPLFINLRIIPDENFKYDLIAKYILDSNLNLYDKPGPTKTLLGNVKDSALKIYDKLQNTFDKKVLVKPENFSNNNGVTCYNNCHVEDYTRYSAAYDDITYKTQKRDIIEGIENKDEDENIKDKIERLTEQVDKCKVLIKNPDTNDTIVNMCEQMKQSLNDAQIEEMELETDKEMNETIGGMSSNNLTSPNSGSNDTTSDDYVAGSSRMEHEIDVQENKISGLESDLAHKTLLISEKTSELKTLNRSINDYSNLLQDEKSKMTDVLTNEISCERCVTGDTTLEELKGKVVISIELNEYNIGYEKSRLKDIENINIKQYPSTGEVPDKDGFYSVIYTKSGFRTHENNTTVLVVALNDTSKASLSKAFNNKSIQIVSITNSASSDDNIHYHDLFKEYRQGIAPMNIIKSKV